MNAVMYTAQGGGLHPTLLLLHGFPGNEQNLDLAQTSRLEVVHLSSNDPEDLTLRAARLLGEADRIYHHADVPDTILHRARADAVHILVTRPPEALEPGLSLLLVLRN